MREPLQPSPTNDLPDLLMLQAKAQRLTALNARVADLSDEELREILLLRQELKDGITLVRRAVDTLCIELDKALEKGWAVQSTLSEVRQLRPDFTQFNAVISSLDNKVLINLIAALKAWLVEEPVGPPGLPDEPSPEDQLNETAGPPTAPDSPPVAEEKAQQQATGDELAFTPDPGASRVAKERATEEALLPPEDNPSPEAVAAVVPVEPGSEPVPPLMDAQSESARESEDDERVDSLVEIDTVTESKSPDEESEPAAPPQKVTGDGQLGEKPSSGEPVVVPREETRAGDKESSRQHGRSRTKVRPPIVAIPTLKATEKPSTRAPEVSIWDLPVGPTITSGDALFNRACLTLAKWLEHWAQLPKAYLLLSWISENHTRFARWYPVPALCKIAHHAFMPDGRGEADVCPSLEALRQTLNEGSTVELRALSWHLAAALTLLQGEEQTLEMLEYRAWTQRPELEAWLRLGETVSTYLRQTTMPLSEAVHQLKSQTTLPDPKHARDSAQRTLAALTRPSRFDFLKGQRLSSYIDREFAWLSRNLAQNTLDDKVTKWAKDFKPERALDRWSREVEPLTIPIVGPARQTILRDLRALQSHTSRWVKLHLAAESSDQAKRDPGAFALEQFGQTVFEESDAWCRAWEDVRSQCPTLVAWSHLMLQRLEDVLQPLATGETQE